MPTEPTKPSDPNHIAIQTIRGLSMDAVQAANSGHPGTPMSLAPLGWLIFNQLRKHDPKNPDWADRDRFVLSCGHASMLQYALLHLSGYDVSLDDIKNFRQWQSKTPGHPEYRHTPGIETTTGPLGQGVATAVGMAMAERHLAKRFNQNGHNMVDHRTWVIASDGDLQEGISSEASSLAGHLKLGKLIVFWDDNRISIDGNTELSFSEDVVKRYQSYGWHTAHVKDGNNLAELERAAKEAMDDERPSFIRVQTIIGYPSPNKQNTAGAHGAPLGEEEIKLTKKEMGWPDEAFFVPKEMDAIQDAVVQKGAQQRQAWEKQKYAYGIALPEQAQAFEDALCGKLPEGWEDKLPCFEASEKGIATRKVSGQIIQALGENIPNFVGGSADLTDSNNVRMKGTEDFRSDQPGVPQTIYFGIREHAMGAIVNGLVLHGGVSAFGATFLIFSDYVRPAIRLAALMNIPSKFVFTHDSIGLGEDGPTHQPVEHMAALRCIPNVTAFRPGDANEVRECWKAMMACEGPSAIALTRQDIPVFDRKVVASEAGVHKGAYILSEAKGGKPQAILLASGSEVSLAMEARQKLEAENIFVRVVSMPSWELFEKQSQAYKDEVLPPAIETRIAIEAASSFGWDRWVGSKGDFVTVDTFGASAPYKTVYQNYGITTENIVQKVKNLL